MESRPSQKGLIAAIVFASAVISGSLVFSSLSLTGQLGANVIGAPATTEVANIDQKIADSIEEYAKRQAQPSGVQAAPAVRNTDTAANVRKADPEVDHILGAEDARVTLVEYSDFECPYCRSFHATAKQLVEEYDGQVNWTYRHYPLPSHDPEATQMAVASECAAELGGNEAFWKYADALFSPSTARTGDSVKWLAEVGGNLGLDTNKMATCIEENKYLEKVQASYAEGSSFGVNGTPGNFLVDNKTGKVQFVPGALPLSRLKTLVDSMIAE